MKEIQLANNKGVVFIDNKDYDLVLQYKWCLPTRDKYPTISIHAGYYKQK
jgi:hypothetical protein